MQIDWQEGPIEGCTVSALDKYVDERGWLAEFFRHDELAPSLHPAMGYVSLSHPGRARGPHEHREQTDRFVFATGRFLLYLWDAREEASTYGHRQTHEVGADRPVVTVIPPGVVHAYRNVGDADALIVNCPNRLYAGEDKAETVDEIRHEDRDNSPFALD